MAPMYDEDEDVWTGSGLSRDIAKRRLMERQNLPTGPSGGDRALGAVKGTLGGATAGASLGSIIPGVGSAIGAGVGALVGGVGGATNANPSEKAPTIQEFDQGKDALKQAYNAVEQPIKRAYNRFKALKETEENPMLDLSDADFGY
jgi:phage tail tape-measure protein